MLALILPTTLALFGREQTICYIMLVLVTRTLLLLAARHVQNVQTGGSSETISLESAGMK